MRIVVRAKPGAKKASIKEEPQELFDAAAARGASGAAVPERRFTVAVTARAVEGRANEAIVAAVAEYFHVPRTAVRIVKGERTREKVLEVDVIK